MAGPGPDARSNTRTMTGICLHAGSMSPCEADGPVEPASRRVAPRGRAWHKERRHCAAPCAKSRL